MDQHQPKKQRGGRKAKAFDSKPKIPRPYSAWLIYFQLQCEWILQKQLGVVNAFTEDTFIATDPSYEGPPLPSMFQDLKLPSDWWKPGKGRRRRRLHRKVRLRREISIHKCGVFMLRDSRQHSIDMISQFSDSDISV